MTTAHEPRRGAGVHLSAEDLSAAAEGTQPAAEGASGHLLHCTECRAEVDAIARLLAALATMDRPPIPEHVAIRIDAALTREATDRTNAVPSAGSSSRALNSAEPATATRDRSSGGGRRWLLSRRVGWGLASLAVLAGGLALTVNLVSSNRTTATSSSGSAAINPNASTYGGAPQRGAPNRLTTPDEASASALAVWVKQVLTDDKPATRINSPCVADPAFAGESPLRVVNGAYNGMPATLVVYANSGDPATVRAIAYAQPCAPLHFRVLAQGIVAK